MQFMMLMIPNVYRGNKKLDPGFVPDPKKIEEMARFNEELGKAVKILSLNGLHPLNTGARVSSGKGKPTVTDGPFIDESALESVEALATELGADPYRRMAELERARLAHTLSVTSRCAYGS